ncbi:MAG: AAA family ATPase [Bacteroidia bacterium]
MPGHRLSLGESIDMLPLEVRNLGPLKEAVLEPADFTVLVGPQGTGKSLLLQTIYLVQETDFIRRRLRQAREPYRSIREFLYLFFGRGYEGLIGPETSIWVGPSPYLLRDALRKPLPASVIQAKGMYIPAARSGALWRGITHPFKEHSPGVPFVLRLFSHFLHWYLHLPLQRHSFRPSPAFLFQAVSMEIWGGFERYIRFSPQFEIGLKKGKEVRLPYTSLSFGQREFMPLYFALRFLYGPRGARKIKHLTYVIIEEPELGLHPKGIKVTFLLLLELLHRGYKVYLSTHSHDILEMVWLMRTLQKEGAIAEDVLSFFELPREEEGAVELASVALEKSYRVYYFAKSGGVKDISSLDPCAEDEDTADWGGLSTLATRASHVIAEVMRRHE